MPAVKFCVVDGGKELGTAGPVSNVVGNAPVMLAPGRIVVGMRVIMDGSEPDESEEDDRSVDESGAVTEVDRVVTVFIKVVVVGRAFCSRPR